MRWLWKYLPAEKRLNGGKNKRLFMKTSALQTLNGVDKYLNLFFFRFLMIRSPSLKKSIGIVSVPAILSPCCFLISDRNTIPLFLWSSGQAALPRSLWLAATSNYCDDYPAGCRCCVSSPLPAPLDQTGESRRRNQSRLLLLWSATIPPRFLPFPSRDSLFISLPTATAYVNLLLLLFISEHTWNLSAVYF